MTTERFKELDCLRGVASLSIVFFHFFAGTKAFDIYFKYGGTTVDLFFIISGFVIFLSVRNNNSWIDFVKKRVLRLYPTYWICLTITTLSIILNHYFLSTDNQGLFFRFLTNFTMFQYYFKVDDMDGPYWTLAIELMFYLLIAFLLLLNGLNKIEIIGVLILSLSVFLYFCLLPYYPLIYHSINRAFPLINHWPMFFAGILFYKQKKDKETILRYVLIVVCFFVGLLVFRKASRTADFISIFQYGIVLTIYFLLFFLLVKDLLKFINFNFFIFLGNISYTLYLIHQYIGRDLLLKNITNYTKLYWGVGCLLSVLFSVFLSIVITYYLEPPLRKILKKSLFDGRYMKNDQKNR
ncbi:MAG TPA: acyltransferase [Mucilaginibacter sp.]|nr:acyltransferase [Mucilaginibacter sp.]